MNASAEWPVRQLSESDGPLHDSLQAVCLVCALLQTGMGGYRWIRCISMHWLFGYATKIGATVWTGPAECAVETFGDIPLNCDCADG